MKFLPFSGSSTNVTTGLSVRKDKEVVLSLLILVLQGGLESINPNMDKKAYPEPKE